MESAGDGVGAGEGGAVEDEMTDGAPVLEGGPQHDRPAGQLQRRINVVSQEENAVIG